jgi:hypothetical protein
MQAFLLLQVLFHLVITSIIDVFTFPLVKNSQLAHRLPCSSVCTWKLGVSHNLRFTPLQIKLYKMSVMCAKRRIGNTNLQTPKAHSINSMPQMEPNHNPFQIVNCYF